MTKLATTGIHGADGVNEGLDVIPPIHVTTTYKYSSNPDDLVPFGARGNEEEYPKVLVYSRWTHPNGERIEAIVGKLTNSHATVYSSGLSAFSAALTYFNPRQLFIAQAYHGCLGIAKIWARNYGMKQFSLSDEDLKKLQPGDVIHLETPVNPLSNVFDIQHYADKAHAAGAFLLVDSTFAPLQDPLAFGADMVMHSATKYFGGHSDLLSGLLLTKSKDVAYQLYEDRLHLGTNIGSLESSLLLRSLKTFELRVKKQSSNAIKLVAYLHDNINNIPNLSKVYHSSLQKDAFVETQLNGVHSPTFSIEVSTAEFAKTLPNRLKYFVHATSLGGAESLIEWRCLTDPHTSRTLLRVSVGLEDADDLIEDLSNALKLTA